MPDRPFISDESVLMRWMNLELSKINRGVVTERKKLTDLAAMNDPKTATRGGSEYRFDHHILALLVEKLPKNLADKIRLPVPCYFDSSVSDSCYITDARAVEMLQYLREISPMREMTDGRLWIGRAIVFDIMRKYPSVIQIVMM